MTVVCAVCLCCTVLPPCLQGLLFSFYFSASCILESEWRPFCPVTQQVRRPSFVLGLHLRVLCIHEFFGWLKYF